MGRPGVSRGRPRCRRGSGGAGAAETPPRGEEAALGGRTPPGVWGARDPPGRWRRRVASADLGALLPPPGPPLQRGASPRAAFNSSVPVGAGRWVARSLARLWTPHGLSPWSPYLWKPREPYPWLLPWLLVTAGVRVCLPISFLKRQRRDRGSGPLRSRSRAPRTPLTSGRRRPRMEPRSRLLRSRGGRGTVFSPAR